jgi:hypothetical protein
MSDQDTASSDRDTSSATSPTEPAQTTPAKSGGAGKRIGAILSAVLIGLVVVGVRWYLNQDKTADAKAGDCIAIRDIKEGETSDASDAKVVDCNSAEARYNVIGRVNNKTKAEFDADHVGAICTGAGFADTEAYVWFGPPGGNGYILCLTPR